jgi:ankyrin repeat protein
MNFFHHQGENLLCVTNTKRLFTLIEYLIVDVRMVHVNSITNFLRERQHSTRHFDINALNEYGHTPLTFCITEITGNVENREHVEDVKHAVVNVLIKHGASVHVQVPQNGGLLSSILHIACGTSCQVNIVRLLLENGINVDVRNTHQQTPLHFAALQEKIDLVSLLLDYCANPIAMDKYGDTPMLYLMTAFCFNINCIREESRLLRISNCFDLLFCKKQCLNNIGHDGTSILFKVVNGLGGQQIIKNQFITKLLELGADVNIGFAKPRFIGSTGFDKIRYNDCTYTYLEDNIEVAYVLGDTPLHAASMIGDLNTVKLLLCYNPDVNCTNFYQKTALDYASMKRQHEVRDEIMFYKRKNIFDYYRSNI